MERLLVVPGRIDPSIPRAEIIDGLIGSALAEHPLGTPETCIDRMVHQIRTSGCRQVEAQQGGRDPPGPAPADRDPPGVRAAQHGRPSAAATLRLAAVTMANCPGRHRSATSGASMCRNR